MCFTVQLSRFCCLATAYSYYHIHLCLSRTFFIFFNFFQSQKRRRRDLNPRAAINDLLPFQGSPFGQLGYFSKLPYSITVVFLFCSNSKYDYNASFLICQVLFLIFFINASDKAERVGFEPTRPCGQTVFKTASL